MSDLSVSIARTSLSLSPLVLADDGTTYRITEDGIGRPGRTWRLGQMPDSADTHGTEYISAALEQTNLPLKVLVQAASSAALEAALDDLEDALGQFAYETTVTIDGAARTWTCGPASSQASIDSGQVAAHLSEVTITIPVYPIAGA